jgi:hypothetical protein
MSDLVEMSEIEVESVAGGRAVGSITIQANINVGPQVAVGLAVLSPHAIVLADNYSAVAQVNFAVPVF